MTSRWRQVDEVEQLLGEGDEALAAGDTERAAELVRAMAELVGDQDARVAYLDALVAWEIEGPEAAMLRLEDALRGDPDDADIRHAAALACEELGDGEGMRRHFLQTRIIDARQDRDAGVGSPAELDFIEQVALDAIEALPSEIRSQLQNVTIDVHLRPSLRLVSEGFDPRALGIFDVPEIVEHARLADTPKRILLYAANLLCAFREPDVLAEQVKATVLHEIAHYFGFEEHEMERLGLA